MKTLINRVVSLAKSRCSQETRLISVYFIDTPALERGSR